MIVSAIKNETQLNDLMRLVGYRLFPQGKQVNFLSNKTKKLVINNIVFCLVFILQTDEKNSQVSKLA